MAIYSVRTVTNSGRKATLRREAENESELVDSLSQLGVSVTRVLRVRESIPPAKATYTIKQASLVEFTDRLEILYTAGIPLVDALHEVQRSTSDPHMRSICQSFRDRLRDGARLSEVMDQFPRAFPRYYRAAVKSGEETGTLEAVLHRLVVQLEWQQGIRSTLVQAFTYPAILAVAVFGLILFMFTFLLPRLTAVYEKANVKLPKPTLILMDCSTFLRVHGFQLLCTAALAIVLFRVARSKSASRAVIDRFYLRIPAIGDLLRKASSASFVSTLHTLHHAGTPILVALDFARLSINNEALNREIVGVIDLVSQGIPLHEAISTAQEIDPLVARMISIGERSGALDESLEHVIRLYDREVRASTKRLITFLEPAILVFAGASVGFIIVATLLPMFRMLAAVKR